MKAPLDTTYFFSFDCGDKYYAELLREHFRKKLCSMVEAIRKQEYEEGYKDGRGKKAKKGYFFTWLKTYLQ